MAESVYAHGWGACGEILGGSSPPYDTINKAVTSCYCLIYFDRKGRRTPPNGVRSGFKRICVRIERSEIRIANRFCWQVRSTANKTLWAWSKSKTVPPSTPYKIMRLYASIILYSQYGCRREHLSGVQRLASRGWSAFAIVRTAQEAKHGIAV